MCVYIFMYTGWGWEEKEVNELRILKLDKI